MICALLAPLALAGCMDVAAPGASNVTTRLHGWARIDHVTLRPERVVEDSRCPMNARCIQAGKAVVRVTIRDGGRARTLNLTLGQPVAIRGGTIALVGVTPEKMAGAQPKPRPPYRFTFALRD